MAETLGERYEYRSGQDKMLRFVAERYNEGGIGLVEGGTGIGKSLAYLLPAICWAVLNGERTVISTKTKNLQTQLFEEDLRLAVKVLSKDPDFAAMLLQQLANRNFERVSEVLAKAPHLAGPFLGSRVHKARKYAAEALGIRSDVVAPLKKQLQHEYAEAVTEELGGDSDLLAKRLQQRLNADFGSVVNTLKKDSSIAKEILSQVVEGAVFKGRSNYISIRRARLAAESAPSLFRKDKSHQLRALVDWAEHTMDGSKSDPSLPEHTPEVWEEVKSTSSACLREDCTFFEQCHYQRARRAVMSAQVAIVNHSLFFSDLKIRINSKDSLDRAVLPPYTRVIFDEAHYVPDEATARLGREISRKEMYEVLARLDDGGKGILASIESGLGDAWLRGIIKNLLGHIQNVVRPSTQRLRSRLEEFFTSLEPWLASKLRKRESTVHITQTSNPIANSDIRNALVAVLELLIRLKQELQKLEVQVHGLLTPHLERHVKALLSYKNRVDHVLQDLRYAKRSSNPPQEGALTEILRRFETLKKRLGALAQPASDTYSSEVFLNPSSCRKRLGYLNSALQRCLEAVNSGAIPSGEAHRRTHDFLRYLKQNLEESIQVADRATMLQGRRLDLESCKKRLDRIDRVLRSCFLLQSQEKDMERWLQLRKGDSTGYQLIFHSIPLRIGPLLSEHLFQKNKTDIFTSATLTFKDDFTHYRNALDLNGSTTGIKQAVFHSPFNHWKQSRLIVPTDLGTDYKDVALPDATAKVIIDMARITHGGLFALFRSHDALKKVAEILRQRDIFARYPLLVQGKRSRFQLLEDFKDSGSAVLLGTNSFWEGVDVPGQALRALVIHKLPFRNPTDPVYQMRAVIVEARGINAFRELMVPSAALGTKQGVGRLIRTRHDKGVIVLLDKRVWSKPGFGIDILVTLPSIRLIVEPWEEAKRKVIEFYSSQASHGNRVDGEILHYRVI